MTIAITAGVYHFANLVIKPSLLDLFAEAPSISSSILDAVESQASFTVLIRSVPLILMQPDSTSSPTVTSRGNDSPVNAEVLRPELPSITMPSSGILSPARTKIISPTCTFSQSVSIISPFFSRFALSGRISVRAAMELLLRPIASSSKNSPIQYRSITSTASVCSPIQSAPIEATDIRKFSSMKLPETRPCTASNSTL